jgi:hypothetical protein
MLGKDFVEVKTITPDKKSDGVQVKRAGNFGKLVVVKISDDFQFAARMVDRRILMKGSGNWATLSWDAMIAGEKDQDFHRSFPIKKGPSRREPPRLSHCPAAASATSSPPSPDTGRIRISLNSPMFDSHESP